jgi:hypothetical protein
MLSPGDSVLRLDEEQQDAAGNLQESIETFQEDANLKDFVESTRCPEHHAGTYPPSIREATAHRAHDWVLGAFANRFIAG